MKVTNNEYEVIIRSLNVLIHYHKESDLYIKEAEALKDKLKKEYNRIAEINIADGMTADEEELYPSRVYDEYGGVPNDSRKVE